MASNDRRTNLGRLAAESKRAAIEGGNDDDDLWAESLDEVAIEDARAAAQPTHDGLSVSTASSASGTVVYSMHDAHEVLSVGSTIAADEAQAAAPAEEESTSIGAAIFAPVATDKAIGGEKVTLSTVRPVVTSTAVGDQAAEEFAMFLRSLERVTSEDEMPASMLARTYRVLNAYPRLPQQVACLKWQQHGNFPQGTSDCCFMPCIHEGYLYASLVTPTCPPGSAQLQRAQLAGSSALQWQEDSLPGAVGYQKWPRNSYFFSHSTGLYFIGKAGKDSLYTVFNRPSGTPSWGAVLPFPDQTCTWVDFGFVVHDDQLVVCRGATQGGTSMSLIQLCLFDDEPRWETLATHLPPTAAFCTPSLAIYNNKVCVTGSEKHRDVYTFIRDGSGASASGRWDKTCIKPTPFKRCAVANINGSLVAVGGYDGNIMYTYHPEVFMYHQDESGDGQWMPMPKLITGRRRPYLLTAPGMMLVLSGSKPLLVSSIETLRLPDQ